MRSFIKTISFISFIVLCTGLNAQVDSQLSEEEYRQWSNNSQCQTIVPWSQLKAASCQYTPCDDSLVIYANYPVNTIPLKEMSIRCVVFSDDNGSNTVTDASIYTYLDYVNALFQPYRFKFNVFEIVKVQSTTVNHAPLSNWQNTDTYQQTYGENQDEMLIYS